MTGTPTDKPPAADASAADQIAPPQVADGAAVQPAAGSDAGADGSGAAPAAGAGATPQPTATAAAGAGADSAKPSGGAPAADWRDDRIRVLTARLREAEDKRAALSAGGDAAAAPPPAAGTKTEAQLRAEIAAEIAANTAQREFNERCNVVARQGVEQFPEDFNARVAELRRTVADWNDPAQAGPYFRMLEAAIETGKAPAVLHQLGGDLNEAVRIMSLTPVKMAMELTKLATGLGASGDQPKPIPRMGVMPSTQGAIDPTDAARADSLSTAEWMKRREEQIARSPDRRLRA